MLFKNITILDENFEIKENMYVSTEDDIIKYIGEKEPSEYKGEVYDGKGKLLMPGFYNAHAHSPMTLVRGYGENMNLQDWLFKRIFPFEDHLNSNAVYYGQMLAMAESLRFGIVSSSDMYYFIDDMVKATTDAGLKANICRSISHFDDSDPWEGERLKEMKRTFEAYHMTENGKIKIDCSLHSEYTNNMLSIQAVTDYAKSVNTGMQIHISETKKEHDECKEKYGMTPIQLFNKAGSWDVPSVAAHCVWIEGEDFDIIKEKGITIAANPISNLKLASGVSNVPEFLRRGLKVAIGTDSVCSNNSLNFFEEMKAFATASKMMYKDPTAVTPKEALYAATRAGALAQGRDDCGLLKEGFKADLIALDISKPNMFPVHNMLNNLVYSMDGGDITLTMVDGKVLYRDGKYETIDIEKVIFETQKATNGILSEL